MFIDDHFRVFSDGEEAPVPAGDAKVVGAIFRVDEGIKRLLDLGAAGGSRVGGGSQTTTPILVTRERVCVPGPRRHDQLGVGVDVFCCGWAGVERGQIGGGGGK